MANIDFGKGKFMVGIVFGFEYSGVTLSFAGDYYENPMKISAVCLNKSSTRVPTNVLLKPDKSLQSFGYQADDDYYDLLETSKERSSAYSYFRRFSNYHSLREDTLLEDQEGKTLPARDLFRLVFQYILHGYIFGMDLNLTWKYVLVVPAIWDMESKEFIKKMAQEAGIAEKYVQVVSEAEAAISFYQHVPNVKQGPFLKEGTKYMVVSLEGGTIEVSVLKRLVDRSFTDLRPSRKAGMTSKSVYNIAKEFLEDVFGPDNIRQFKVHSSREFKSMLQWFVNRLTFVDTDQRFVTDSVAMCLPVELIEIVKKNSDCEISKMLLQSKYRDSVRYIRSKLKMSKYTFFDIFKPLCDGLMHLVQDFLNDKKCQGLQYILMVGEFAECQMFQNAILSVVSEGQEILCYRPTDAVISGGALYGHCKRPVLKKPPSARLFVAALDFGTTYSGYAFSAKHEFKSNPLTINVNNWEAGTKALISHKSPSAILLKPDMSFLSFGYQAENNFLQLAEEGEEGKYYFFHRFKMILHNNPTLRRSTMLKDETGKTLSAATVFSHAIRHLKDHLFKAVEDSFPEIQEKDIQYVLTVPAIWDDAAKQFMRGIAKEAGIKDDQLMIALEPEAASIYCQYIPIQTSSERGDLSQLANPGTRYMVVDLGGGTADITLHLKKDDGSLQELHSAVGGSFGGIIVDAAFVNLLEDIFGSDNIQKLKEESMEDFIDLFREFEIKKRSINTDTNGNVTIIMPFALFDILKQDKSKKSINEAIQQSSYKDTVTLSKQRLRIQDDTFRKLFKPAIDGILEKMNEIFSDPNVEDVEYILMVGGFSSSNLVQNAVRQKFNERRIIIPDDADLAVLKGAVLYGHKPNTITSRVARKTYGIKACPIFDSKRHPKSKKVVINEIARCKDVFLRYISKGERVTPGHQMSNTVEVLHPNDGKFDCEVHWSEAANPQFIDEVGCHRLGILTVPLEDTVTGEDEIEETIIFGETELILQARDLHTGKIYQTYFDFFEGPD